jgi:hypothetical protein
LTVGANTITNLGLTAMTVTGITFTGADAGDFTQTKTCAAALAPRASCTVSFTFKPVVKGSRSATAVIADNALISTESIALSGTGD